MGAWWGSIRGRSLRLQRRAERRGGGCEEDPVSEHVSEVSQLGCGACSSWATTAAYTGAEGGACKQAGSEPSLQSTAEEASMDISTPALKNYGEAHCRLLA